MNFCSVIFYVGLTTIIVAQHGVEGEENDCKDMNPHCKSVLKNCETKMLVKRFCKKSCGLCGPSPPTTDTGSQPAPTPAPKQTRPSLPPLTPDTDCKDIIPSCKSVKRKCKTNNLTRRYCKRTCGLCGSRPAPKQTRPSLPPLTPDTDCKDSISQCKTVNYDCRKSNLMKIYCKKTCGLCGPLPSPKPTPPQDPDCKDNHPQCNRLPWDCKTSPEMSVLCKRTCGLCDCKDNIIMCETLPWDCRTDPKMRRYCRKTCGFCGSQPAPPPNPNPVCSDSLPRQWCNDMEPRCRSDHTVRRDCKTTCGLCAK